MSDYNELLTLAEHYDLNAELNSPNTEISKEYAETAALLRRVAVTTKEEYQSIVVDTLRIWSALA